MNEKNKKTLVDLMRPKTVVGSALQNEYGSMPYYGEARTDSLIAIINQILKNNVGTFGQSFPEVGYRSMPEASRFTDREIKSLVKRDDTFYEKMIEDERQETATKAAIMLDLLRSGEYKNNAQKLFDDFTKLDVRKVFGDKSSQ
jgi:hypothetical protein